MKRPVTSLFALLFALTAVPAWAQRHEAIHEFYITDHEQDRDRGPRETETVDRTVPLPANGTLRLKTFSGRVRITGTSGDQVVIHAIRRASRDRLNDIKLEVTTSGSTVDIDANHRVVERRNDNVVETDFD